MQDMINEAVKALNARLAGDALTGSARLVISDEGALIVDADGARVSDDTADVTLRADAATFAAIIDGSLDPAAAFMSGKLVIDGDMGVALQLGRALS